jgi:hypothetical protein
VIDGLWKRRVMANGAAHRLLGLLRTPTTAALGGGLRKPVARAIFLRAVGRKAAFIKRGRGWTSAASIWQARRATRPTTSKGSPHCGPSWRPQPAARRPERRQKPATRRFSTPVSRSQAGELRFYLSPSRNLPAAPARCDLGLVCVFEHLVPRRRKRHTAALSRAAALKLLLEAPRGRPVG